MVQWTAIQINRYKAFRHGVGLALLVKYNGMTFCISPSTIIEGREYILEVDIGEDKDIFGHEIIASYLEAPSESLVLTDIASYLSRIEKDRG